MDEETTESLANSIKEELQKKDDDNEDGPAHEDPDGGYGWVVVAAAFLCNMAMSIGFIGFSVFYVEIVEHFDVSKASSGWIGSFLLSTGNFLGFLFSPLIQKYGCRPVCIFGSLVGALGFVLSSFLVSVPYLYLTYGLLGGIGHGLLFLTSAVIVQGHFTKTRSLAYGISSVGISFGNLFIGPLLRFLLDRYGLRGTLILVGAIYMQTTVGAALYRPPKMKFIKKEKLLLKVSSREDLSDQSDIKLSETQIANKPKRNKKKKKKNFLARSFDFSMFCDVRAVLMFICSCSVQFGICVFNFQLVGRALSIGVSRNLAPVIMSVVGGGNIIGRLLASFIAHRFSNKGLQLAIWAFGSSTFVMLTLVTHSFATMTAVSFIAGIFIGMMFMAQTPVLVEMFGVEKISHTQAFNNWFTALGTLLAVPLSGFLYDISGSYVLPYLVNGSIQLFGAVIAFIMSVVHRRRTKVEKSKPIELDIGVRSEQ